MRRSIAPILGVAAAVAALASVAVCAHSSACTTVACWAALAGPGPLLAPALFAVFGGGLLVMIAGWYAKQRAAIRPHARSPVEPQPYPSVTVIRPVRGRDVGAAENFAAALETGYPGEVETLFIVDEADDPALPLIRQTIAHHLAAGRPGRAEVIVAGAPPADRTGKLNAMVIGARRARGELIAFGDSDTRPDRHVLRKVVDALRSSPGAGSAFAPILVDQRPRGAGDALYALMQNALYAPLAAWASGERRELPFIMGQLMVFTREALAAIGGVESAAGQLVDDMYLGRRLAAAGFKNVMSRHPLHIVTGRMTLRQFFPIYRRWMAFSRNGMPLSFSWRQWRSGLEFWCGVVAVVAACATGHPWAALFPAGALAVLGLSLLSLQRRYGGPSIPLRFAWAAWGFYLLSPVVLIANLVDHRVNWRGREYVVDNGAALHP